MQTMWGTLGRMRTQKERIELMHARAGEIRRQRERRTMGVLSLSCIVVFTGLLAAISKLVIIHPGIDSDGYAGSSLLDSSVGGYILVGVVTFVAAVIITLLCIRYRNKNLRNGKDIDNEDK